MAEIIWIVAVAWAVVGSIIYGAFMLNYFDRLLQGNRGIPFYIWALVLSGLLVCFMIFWPSIFVARWFSHDGP